MVPRKKYCSYTVVVQAAHLCCFAVVMLLSLFDYCTCNVDVATSKFGSDMDTTGSSWVSGSGCTKDDIEVDQGQTSPLPNGIPTYTVEIENVCIDGRRSCRISNIHLRCGWFSSARLIDPAVFRRVGYDDCLLNDGEPLDAGDCISFVYANTYPYPLEVSSVSC